MSVVMQCWGFASGRQCPVAGQYLEWVNINAPEPEPVCSWTNDIEKAMHFDGHAQAMATWTLERTIDPPGSGRTDGDPTMPNRPLTAFSVSIEPYVKPQRHNMAASKCLDCGRELDTATSFDSKQQPKPGDISICLHCGNVMVFADDLSLRELTEQDAHDIAGDPNLLKLQEARAKAMKQQKRNPT